MKVEIGESLIYSFLRHEKNCLITQTNWKPSGNWNISQEIQDRAIYEFDKINKHHAFSGIFNSDLSQTIKQAEIDVLGIDQSNHIYAFEVAFHENGLQYGGKIETKNRIFKKLLRGYVTLKCYFPNHQHSIAFCSPKVNPATEQHIREYFEVLIQDFQTEDTEFHYFSNEKFNSEIAQKTLAKTLTEADSSELFARSIKLFNIFSKFNSSSSQPTQQAQKVENFTPETPQTPLPASSQKTIKINNISVPLTKENGESVQNYIKRIMRLLLNSNALSSQEIERLQDKEYCKKTFHLQFALLREIKDGYKDASGRGRYWSTETFGGNYYVCSQWWKDYHTTYLTRLTQWLLSIKN
jgi:hypothetical protein